MESCRNKTDRAATEATAPVARELPAPPVLPVLTEPRHLTALRALPGQMHRVLRLGLEVQADQAYPRSAD